MSFRYEGCHHLVQGSPDKCEICTLTSDLESIRRERDALLNTPELHDFSKAVVLEAAHQRERWKGEHDKIKTPEDWLWLIAYLATKATQANRYGDYEKYLHHIITCAAACSNWHTLALRPTESAERGKHQEWCRLKDPINTAECDCGASLPIPTGEEGDKEKR